MIKSNKYIEIVRSNTRGLSSLSQESCDAIYAVLARHYNKVGVTCVNNMADLEVLTARQPDLVFLGMEFIPEHSELGLNDPVRIWITTYLDQNGIAYTGSGQIAHELGRDKSLAKQQVLNAGLNTSPLYVVPQGRQLIQNEVPLSYPLFVKPIGRGGGTGIDSDSVVYDFEHLQAKITAISDNLRSDSLIEEYLLGREFSVAILKEEYSTEFSVMPIELIAPQDDRGARILSNAVKSSNAEQVIAVSDMAMKTKVCELALNAFHALNARDYGRIDIRADKYGTPQFLEANLIPSLISGYGSFPKASTLNLGLEYEPMILRIVNLGLAHINEDDYMDGLGIDTTNQPAFPALLTTG